jgi:ribose transport system substrate-binding protein
MVSQLESLTSRYPVPTASDGQGTPSTIASCVGQAAGAGAAGIILDAIPSGMTQNALGGAKAKGVPVIVADQYPPSGTANSNQVAYVPGIVDQPSQIAWWLIASSGGKANAIVAEETDSPSSRAYVQNSLAIFKKYCPGCTIQVKQITATQTTQQLQAAVSSDIQADPGCSTTTRVRGQPPAHAVRHPAVR